MPDLSGALPDVTRALRHFWRWWVGELTALLPRAVATRRPTERVDIILTGGETRIERVRDGVGERLADPRPIEALDDDAWGELEALVGDEGIRLILTPADVYATELVLPRRIGSRLAQAVALQLGELAPLPPDRLRWNASQIEQTGELLRVEVAMVRVDRIEALHALFAVRGLPSPDIWADAGRGPVLVEAVARLGRRLAHARHGRSRPRSCSRSRSPPPWPRR